MSAPHIHLIVNHFPIIGVILGIMIFAAAFVFKNSAYIKAALLLFIISGLFVIPTYLSGEASEDAVEDLPGVSHDIIEAHEGAASAALISLLILTAVSSFAFFRHRNEDISIRKPLVIISLLIALASAGIAGYTGNLGGQIRHTELREGTQQNQQIEQEEDEDEAEEEAENETEDKNDNSGRNRGRGRGGDNK